MTKREIEAMSNEELIVEFAYAVHNFARGYKVYKCDTKQYDNITDEMTKRKLLSKENAETIKRKVTL